MFNLTQSTTSDGAGNTVGFTGKKRGEVQQPGRSHYWVAVVGFLIVIPVVAHLLFSWMGMNPTDDGFNLSMSRRILDGEVPHRDFITPRPAGTAILFTPLVFLGGDYTIWAARFAVWFQIACIAWIWPSAVIRRLGLKTGLIEQVAMAVMTFALTAHNFLLAPWPTIDGIWVASLGLPLCFSSQSIAKAFGYILVGSACLFKQNFFALVPAFLVITGDWRFIRYWLLGIFAGAVYLGFLAMTGGLHDFKVQMTAHTELFQTGISTYIHCWYLYVGALGAYFGLLTASGNAGALVFARTPRNFFAWLILLGSGGLLLVSALSLVWSNDSSAKFSFVLFGMSCGAILYFFYHQSHRIQVFKIGVLVLAVAWTASISAGYNNPSLGGGIALTLLMGCLHSLFQSIDSENRHPGRWRLCLVLGMIIICGSFGLARSKYIYREKPSQELRFGLDGVLTGGKLIKTSEYTFAYMSELQSLIEQYKGQEYAVIPDCPIHWVKSGQRNPLPIDWPHDEELTIPILYNRVIEAMESGRGKRIIFVAKVKPSSLATKPELITKQDTYSIVFYVREHFHKVEETRYWEVFR